MEMPKIIPLPMKKGDKLRRWMLIEVWYFQLKQADGRIANIRIHEGFIFDGASIPWVFRSIYNPVGYLLIASMIHDFCFQYAFYRVFYDDVLGYPAFGTMFYVNQSEADALFKQIANQVYPDHRKKTWVAYKALRIGGWVAWRKNRKKEQAIEKQEQDDS